MTFRLFLLLGFLFFLSSNSNAQRDWGGNHDEENVGKYSLPDPLLLPSGKKVATIKQWNRVQRPYILELFEKNIYGRMPGKPKHTRYSLLEMDTTALNGKAIRKQVAISFSKKDTSAAMVVVMYLPKKNKPVPAFIGLNFLSNPSIDKDTAILPSHYTAIKNGEAAKIIRGEQERRWPLLEIINAGFGVATAFYQDIEPDNSDGWKTGVRETLKKELKIQPDEWGAIGVWAWGLSRIQDYLETDTAVDAHKTIVTGHSRLGKAALWAGAQDQRFAIVISNNSGEGGAALSRRNFGETIQVLNSSFPHWFVQNYRKFNNRPDLLPVDQHMLIALMAPRPVYVASAVEDTWADPKGEFLSLKNAEPVYKLFGKQGIGTAVWPPVNQPVSSLFMGYHMRTGKHDIILYDWQRYIDFAKKYFKMK